MRMSFQDTYPVQQVQGLVDELGDGSSRLESMSHPCAAVGLQAAYSTDDIREFQQLDRVLGQVLNQWLESHQPVEYGVVEIITPTDESGNSCRWKTRDIVWKMSTRT